MQSMRSARALVPMQPSKAPPTQFLQPLVRMQSLARAPPPSSTDKLEMQAEKKVERDTLKAMAMTGALLAGQSTAHAYTLTPTLKSLLSSFAAGGVVVAVAAAAIIAVSNLDPV